MRAVGPTRLPNSRAYNNKKEESALLSSFFWWLSGLPYLCL